MQEEGKLSLRLRELGGLIRIAGDLASEDGSKYTTAAHVLGARKLQSHSSSKSLTA